MDDTNSYDVIIIGGSYAGLSAAMTLGRSLRHVLIIDANSPCNRAANHAHNLIGFDGDSPEEISKKAKEQVLKYHTVTYLNASAVAMSGRENEFEVVIDNGLRFGAKKVLLATGVTDNIPEITGLQECWGKTAVHCPYCHGYEIADLKIGILMHGDVALEMTKSIRQWSKDLVLFSNGNDDISEQHLAWFAEKNIPVFKRNIIEIKHEQGTIKSVELEDGESVAVDALFVRPGISQQMDIPLQMGCKFDDHGFIIVDESKKTNIPGMFAAGDNTTALRTLSNAIAAGTIAGININNELTEENSES